MKYGFFDFIATFVMFKFFFILLLSATIIFIFIAKSYKFPNFSPSQIVDSAIFELNIQSGLSNVSETELEYNFDYDKLIKDLKIENKLFPFFGFPFITRKYLDRDIFRSFSDFVYTFKFNNVEPEKVKCGDIIFVKTDYNKDFIENYHPKIKNPYILITHESDIGVRSSWQLKYLNEENVIAWFAQEALVRHPKLHGLPIGIDNPLNQNFSTIYNIGKNIIPYSKKKYLIYLNFSLHTNKNRIKVLEHFQQIYANNSNVLIDTDRISWKDYLIRMKNSKFVLSPPGSGIDCYRTWEALMMGSVPIVFKSGLEPVYGDMPVMVVKDWNEVTEENMQKFEEEKLTNFSKDGFPWRPRIWLRYWIKEIFSTKFNYIKKYC